MCETNRALCNTIGSHPHILNDKLTCKVESHILAQCFNFTLPILPKDIESNTVLFRIDNTF